MVVYRLGEDKIWVEVKSEYQREAERTELLETEVAFGTPVLDRHVQQDQSKGWWHLRKARSLRGICSSQCF